MTAFTKFLGGGVAIAALAVAAPAAAQFFPGMGYPGVGYGYPGYGAPGYRAPGYSPYGYGVNSQAAEAQCTAAVQSRLGGYGSGYGYGAGGRVLGVSHVEPGAGGGLLVRGVASSGGYGGYGYAAQRPDLTWRCRTDFRGLVVDVDVRPARPAYGNYGYTPYNNYNDYSQYGYVRY
ncbi:MAG TPA: hypothetical protein VFW39_06150 [Sphingomicrobium sp.]|nr:hypothetical protein [Sphingomicrobium sp.]